MHTNDSAEQHEPLIGLAPLVRMAFAGQDLTPIRIRLEERIERDPQDANAWMDLSTVMQLGFNRDMGLVMQAEALKRQQLYRTPAKGKTGLRLLVLKAAGELMDNAPIEFLLEESDIAVDQLYLPTHLTELPEHDLLYVAIGQSERNAPLLQELAKVLQSWPRPVLNRPDRIAATARDSVHTLLRDAPGVVTPAIRRIDRALLAQTGDGSVSIESLLADTPFPVTLRPEDSQAGQGLERMDSPADIAAYLERYPQETFYIAGFVDYSSADGLFRKQRIVLIDGNPFAGHMGVSDHWIIHYLNAGMQESAEKRREEAAFMDGFEEFASRHAEALHAINERIGLDYLVIDCAETKEGDLLVFEVDAGAIIHDMDPPDIFPYKSAHMRRLFDAFRAMLHQRGAQTAPV